MSAGGQKSSTQSQQQSFIDPTQMSFLKSLWGGAQDQVKPGQMGQTAGAAAVPGATASGNALGKLNSLMAKPLAGQGGILSALERLGSVQNGMKAQQGNLDTLQRLGNPTGQIAAQSRSLRSGLKEQFAEEINPAISGSAIAAGGFGGGRQGVAQGQAAGEIADAYTQGLGQITADANNLALGATTARGDLINNTRAQAMTATGLRSDVLARGNDTILQSAAMVPDLGAARLGFGTANQNAMLQAMQALASIYGNPSVLSRASSGGSDKKFSFGFA